MTRNQLPYHLPLTPPFTLHYLTTFHSIPLHSITCHHMPSHYITFGYTSLYPLLPFTYHLIHSLSVSASSVSVWCRFVSLTSQPLCLFLSFSVTLSLCHSVTLSLCHSTSIHTYRTGSDCNSFAQTTKTNKTVNQLNRRNQIVHCRCRSPNNQPNQTKPNHHSFSFSISFSLLSLPSSPLCATPPPTHHPPHCFVCRVVLCRVVLCCAVWLCCCFHLFLFSTCFLSVFLLVCWCLLSLSLFLFLSCSLLSFSLCLSLPVCMFLLFCRLRSRPLPSSPPPLLLRAALRPCYLPSFSVNFFDSILSYIATSPHAASLFTFCFSFSCCVSSVIHSTSIQLLLPSTTFVFTPLRRGITALPLACSS